MLRDIADGIDYAIDERESSKDKGGPRKYYWAHPATKSLVNNGIFVEALIMPVRVTEDSDYPVVSCEAQLPVMVMASDILASDDPEVANHISTLWCYHKDSRALLAV